LAVIREAHLVFPDAQLIVVSILPRGESLQQAEATIATTNHAIKAAVSTDHFQFLEAFDAFLGDSQGTSSLYLPGNLHLTLRGYEVLNDMLRRLLADWQR
jgi:hypothetical protein